MSYDCLLVHIGHRYRLPLHKLHQIYLMPRDGPLNINNITSSFKLNCPSERLNLSFFSNWFLNYLSVFIKLFNNGVLVNIPTCIESPNKCWSEFYWLNILLQHPHSFPLVIFFLFIRIGINLVFFPNIHLAIVINSGFILFSKK